MCSPGSGKLGSHFPWPAALSWAADVETPRYSCHRRVWWPHEVCHNVTWHPSLSSSPIISGDILSWLWQLTWLRCGRSFSRLPGLSRPEPELPRIWELENLRAQSHRNFQSRDTRGLFLFPSSPQFYGTNTRQVTNTQCIPYQLLTHYFNSKVMPLVQCQCQIEDIKHR